MNVNCNIIIIVIFFTNSSDFFVYYVWATFPSLITNIRLMIIKTNNSNCFQIIDKFWIIQTTNPTINCISFFNFEIKSKLVVSISWLYKYILLFKAVIGSSKSKEI